METLTPFAQVPTTPEAIIAQVRRQLTADARQRSPLPVATLERMADRAVRDLWDSRVKTFIPVLALRTAREALYEQAIVVNGSDQVVPRVSSAASTAVLDPARSSADALPVGRDILPLEQHDVLTW